MTVYSKNNPLPIVVLISGNGSNLQAIIDAQKNGLAIDIKAVLSNRADAYGLQRAAQADIPYHVIDHQNYASREEFEKDLAITINQYEPKLIVLAGFMRCLSASFVENYYGKIINIHPSLLPKYPGLNTFKRVLAAKEAKHGVSIHYVNAEVDGGPIICQAAIDILTNDTEQELQQRTHKIEHQLYPQVLEWITSGRIELTNEGVKFDRQLLPKTGKLIECLI